MSTAQRCYKRDFKKNVRREPTLKLGYYLLVNRPLPASIGSDAADEMAHR